jgi:hypothetical protein
MKSEEESIVAAWAKYLEACVLNTCLWLVYISESKRYAIALTVTVINIELIE